MNTLNIYQTRITLFLFAFALVIMEGLKRAQGNICVIAFYFIVFVVFTVTILAGGIR